MGRDGGTLLLASSPLMITLANFVPRPGFLSMIGIVVRRQADDAEDFFADVDADRGQGQRGGIHGILFQGAV
jgi:hypothetical protein